MESNYLTSGDLAMWDTARDGHGNYGCGCGYGYHGRGMAATGIGLGAGLGGAALIGALVIGWGVNQASKARMRAAENAAAGNARAIDILAARAIQDDARSNSINLDVTQTLRNLTGATAQGGSASALATAEALALLNNGGGNGLNSAIGGCNYLRVARVSGSRLCGCDTCGNGE
jgi:hypothetical protein